MDLEDFSDFAGIDAALYGNFKDAKQSETTNYFEIDLVDKLRAKKETNESK